VNQNAQPGTTIYNVATIDGDEIPPTTVIDEDPADPADDPGTPVLPSIPVATDIKPTSCRNPIEVDSKGVLPVAILGTEEFDVTQIDPSTVKLGNVSPLRWSHKDVATPFEPYMGKQDAFDCTTDGRDGYLDLNLKFNMQEVVADLGDVQDGDVLVLQVTGNLMEEYGGTPIVGEDVVVIVEKGK